MNDLISVVIPARNAEQTIGSTIQSVLNQSYSDIEIIVVNDGSSDNTNTEIENLFDDKSNIKLTEIDHSGVAAARNHGIELANGDLIAFLDADDVWHREKLTIQREHLLANKNAAFLYSPIRLIDEHSNILSTSPYLQFEGDVLKHMLLTQFINASSSLLCHKEAVRSVGGFDSTAYMKGHQGCEDYLFSVRMAAKYELAAAPYYLTGYRCHTTNMSNNYGQMQKSKESILRMLQDELPDTPDNVFKWHASHAFTYMGYKALKSGRLVKGMNLISSALANDKSAYLKVTKNIMERHLLFKVKDKYVGNKFETCDINSERNLPLENFYVNILNNNQQFKNWKVSAEDN